MRELDIEMMNLHFPKWKKKIKQEIKTIGILSTSGHENNIIKNIFPDAWITDLNQNAWDLFKPGKEEFDLILACNVFMYSSDPDVWFKHIFEKCKYFWMEDLIRSWRMLSKECANGFGGDDDMMRFCMPPDHLARVEHAYDLRKLSKRTLNFEAYNVPTQIEKDAVSFLVNLKGELK